MDIRTKEQKMFEDWFVSANPAHCFFVTDNPDQFSQEFLNLVFANEPFTVVPKSTDMFDLLAKIGAFKSKGDARKNWKWTDQNIEDGCSSFVVTKRKIGLFIFKPQNE